MTKRRIVNSAAGVILAAGAAAAAIWVIPEQAAPGDEGEVAPALLPIIAAVVVVIFALVQAVTTALGRSGNDNEFDARSALFAVIAAVALGATVLLFMWVGFRIGGIIAIAAIGLAMLPTRRVAIWLLTIAVVLPIAAHTLAWHGLRLALP